MSGLVSNSMWALLRENPSSGFGKNKGADQPAQMRSLISTFVICLSESIISRLTMSQISYFRLVFAAEQAGLNLTFSEPPKTGFVATRFIFNSLLKKASEQLLSDIKGVGQLAFLLQQINLTVILRLK